MRMTRSNFREPSIDNRLPDQFAKPENEQGFAGSEENSRDDIARPMRAQINSGVSHGGGDDPVKLAPTPVKNRATNRNHDVVIRVTRRKRGARAGPFGFGRNTYRRFLENGQDFRIRFLQLDHAHSLDLLR